MNVMVSHRGHMEKMVFNKYFFLPTSDMSSARSIILQAQSILLGTGCRCDPKVKV